MFDKPHRGVTYFGSWAENTAPMYGARDAFRVLERAAGQCSEQDMREDTETVAALAYLSQRYTVRHSACLAFWRALGTPNPLMRAMAVGGCLEAIRSQLPDELIAILAGIDRSR